MNMKGMKMLLTNYEPKIMKDCYIDITRTYEGAKLTKDEIIRLFEAEYNTFRFLFDEIKNSH